MEIDKRLARKLDQYRTSIKGFKDLLALDLTLYEGVVLDGLQNGLIQKFEVCSELTWKLIKSFLFSVHKVDSKTPKLAVKEFYLAGLADNSLYESLVQMQDDRNTLSHLYDEVTFQEILTKLKHYESNMEQVLLIVSKHVTD